MFFSDEFFLLEKLDFWKLELDLAVSGLFKINLDSGFYSMIGLTYVTNVDKDGFLTIDYSIEALYSL